MKALRLSSKRIRIASLVFIVPVLINTGLSAGEIHDAATAGDLDKVRTLLEDDPQLLESKDKDGETPLIKACVGVPDNITQATTASFLIDRGANVNASGLAGRTPLMCVNKRQDDCIDLMQRLIARGADVNACMSYTSRKWTVFCGAAKSGNVNAARLLIQHGADIDVRDIEGTSLHMAINSNRPISGNLADDRKRNEAMAVLLVESGATLQEFSFGNTELHLAAIRGFADLVRALVIRGADVNAVNDHGHTPLYYAARHGHRKAAEALLAAGADNRAIAETNHGKAPQLTEPLREGEAWLWYLAPNVSPNTGYAVKTRNNLLIFDPASQGGSPETGLANGCLNPAELAGQKITVLIGHPSYGRDVPGWAKQLPGATFVLGFKPTSDSDKERGMPRYRLAVPRESFCVGEVRVHTIPAASRLFGMEGLGYLVEVDGVKIFHAGLHATSGDAAEQEAYRREVDYLRRFGPIDMAILPISGRHITVAYEPYLYLIDELSPKAIYLIGEELVTEEHNKCLEVLRARNVPVFYPEGGIAMGERFHFVRERASATPPPDAAVPENRTTPTRSVGRASFEGLGDLPGGNFESLGLRVSTDGSVVVGHGTTSSGKQGFRWTQAEGMVSLGNLPDGGFKQSWAVGVSADGSVIVGYGDPDGSGTWERHRGFRWTSTGGMAEMPRPGGSTRDEALAVSADGSVIVGDGGAQAFRWTSDSRIDKLGTLGVRTNSRAIAISGDGLVAVGSSYDLPS